MCGSKPTSVRNIRLWLLPYEISRLSCSLKNLKSRVKRGYNPTLQNESDIVQFNFDIVQYRSATTTVFLVFNDIYT